MKEYLDQNFRNYRLKALLVSHCGDYGLPPGESSSATHATLIYSFLTGGYYPVGGAGEIAKHILPLIEKKRWKSNYSKSSNRNYH